MRIGKPAARRIVTELSEIISENINLMDENSVIIASTDRKRIGTFHGGSREIMKRHLKELIITGEDEYAGSLPGVNVPIEIDGKIVGVVGITGRFQDIEKYGKIVKQMAEILLMDFGRSGQKSFSSGARRRFINEWIMNEDSFSDPLFTSQGRLLGIDIEKRRNLLIFSPGNLKNIDSVTRQRVMERIEKCLEAGTGRFPDAVLTCIGTRCICLLPESAGSRLREFAYEMKKRAEEECRVKLGAGYDDTPLTGSQIYPAFKRVEKALYVSLRAGGRAPVACRELMLELFLPEISKEARQAFIDRIFNNCSQEEREEYRRLLKAYADCNGSIGRTGEKLFLHKNTIQYKLNKLRQKTGLDPRTIEGASLFYLAIAFIEK